MLLLSIGSTTWSILHVRYVTWYLVHKTVTTNMKDRYTVIFTTARNSRYGVMDVGGLFVTLTFTGGAVSGNPSNYSLADGTYTLTILASHFGGAGFDGENAGRVKTVTLAA